MRTRLRFLLAATAVTTAAGLQWTPTIAQGPPILSVQGHAVWNQSSGLPGGGNNTNQISINAWLDPDGTASGVIEWTFETNPLPGGGGQTVSGYPWTVAVDAISLVDGHSVLVEGVVINSGQVPGDIGLRTGLFVTDNGNGADDQPDELNGILIDAGNFTIR